MVTWGYVLASSQRYWPFVPGIHRSPVNAPEQRPVTQSIDVFFDKTILSLVIWDGIVLTFTSL